MDKGATGAAVHERQRVCMMATQIFQKLDSGHDQTSPLDPSESSGSLGKVGLVLILLTLWTRENLFAPLKGMRENKLDYRPPIQGQKCPEEIGDGYNAWNWYCQWACLCVKLQRCDKISVSTCLGGGAVHARIPWVKQEHVVSLCTYRQKVISRRIPLDIYCASEWNKITFSCTLLLVSSYK